MSHSAASDLGLHCFPITLLGVIPELERFSASGGWTQRNGGLLHRQCINMAICIFFWCYVSNNLLLSECSTLSHKINDHRENSIHMYLGVGFEAGM